MPSFKNIFLSNNHTARPWEWWMFILWRQRLIVLRWADRGQRPQYSVTTRVHCTWGKFKTKREGGRTPKLVAEQWRSNKPCDVRARMQPDPGAGEGPRARGCGAGRFPGSPDLSELLRAADAGCKRLCGRYSIIPPTDHRPLREDQFPFNIFYFTLLAPIIK